VEKTKEEPTTIKKAEEPPSGNKVLATAGAIALLIVLSPLIVAYGVLLIGSGPLMSKQISITKTKLTRCLF
jgi:hypothetical protein